MHRGTEHARFKILALVLVHFLIIFLQHTLGVEAHVGGLEIGQIGLFAADPGRLAQDFVDAWGRAFRKAGA